MNKVNFVLIAGDIYHTATPSIKTQVEFIRRLKTLCINDVAVLMIPGNHDVPTSKAKAHALSIIQEIDFDGATRACNVFDEPCTVNTDVCRIC